MQRKAALDELAGTEFTSDAVVTYGSPTELADLLQEWRQARITGFRIRPGRYPTTSKRSLGDWSLSYRPEACSGAPYEAGTLRGLLGMARPVNRYVAGRRYVAV